MGDLRVLKDGLECIKHHVFKFWRDPRCILDRCPLCRPGGRPVGAVQILHSFEALGLFGSPLTGGLLRVKFQRAPYLRQIPLTCCAGLEWLSFDHNDVSCVLVLDVDIHDVVFPFDCSPRSLPTASTQTHDMGLAAGTRSNRKDCVDGDAQRRARVVIR